MSRVAGENPERLSVARIAGLAFLFRILVLLYVYRLTAFSFVWGDNEAAGIAQSLILHHTYSLGFHGSLKPTGWMGPVYPLLLAGIFLVFGIKTTLAAVVAQVLNCGVAAATVVPMRQLGEICFRSPAKPSGGRRAGTIGALLFALSPYGALIPYIPWETALSGLALAWAVLLTVRCEGAGKNNVAACGVAWGLLALLSPAMLAALPLLLVYLWYRTRQWRRPAAIAGIVVLMAAPWIARNAIVLHDFALRTNGWAEVYFGNIDYSQHPASATSAYRDLSEVDFSRLMRAGVLAYVSAHPSKFVLDSLRRSLTFWCVPSNFSPLPALAALLSLGGIVLAMRNKLPVLPCLLVLLLNPLIYYLCYSMSRYRYPMEPEMWLFAGYLCGEVWRKFVGAGQVHSRAAVKSINH